MDNGFGFALLVSPSNVFFLQYRNLLLQFTVGDIASTWLEAPAILLVSPTHRALFRIGGSVENDREARRQQEIQFALETRRLRQSAARGHLALSRPDEFLLRRESASSTQIAFNEGTAEVFL